MSSYFVNSFSGRYPNGPDYQLLNYGASSGAMNGGTYRDSSSATMHHATGSYGYSYNGMDLTVNSRGGGSGGGAGGHFGGGTVVGDTLGFGSSATERSFRQQSSCSLASAAESLLSPVGGDTKLGARTTSPRTEQQPGNGNLSASNLSSSSSGAGGGGGTAQHFTELDDSSPDAEELQHGRDAGHGNSSGGHPHHQQQPRTGQKQEGGPTGSAAGGAAGSEAQAPQIFPWMRKLHISHGTRRSSVSIPPATTNTSLAVAAYQAIILINVG